MNAVLIGVDDSARSEDAVAFGRQIAARSRSRLIVAAAYEYDDSGGVADYLPYREALETEARQTAQRMSELLEGVPSERVEIAVVADPSPARALHELAERERASLIVVGSTGTGPFGRVLPGATAERLLHDSPCPVAVVPRGYATVARWSIGTIGVAYQAAESDELAVAAGVAAAHAFGAALELIHVAGGMPDDHGAERLARAAASAHATPVQLAGDPAEAIVARTSRLDLLVMGSRGYGPLHSILGGGVSGRVLRDAQCPVVVIPRGADASLGGLFTVAASASSSPPDADVRSPILAAYDPFLLDRAAVELAVALHELSHAPVLAGAVFPAVPVAEMAPATLADPGLLETRDHALERLRQELGVHSISVSGLSAPHELRELARREDAALIVVGSTHRARIGRMLPGSTAERLLHGAACPVALAPHGYRRGPLKTIAVGFADTPEGHAALAAAHMLAEHSGGCVRAVAIAHRSGGGLDELRRAIDALPETVEIQPEVQNGDPAEVLLRISEHMDLIVCGSRGYGPLRSVLLGGVSRRVVDGAHCPVLVVPRGVERPLDRLFAVAANRAAG